jgi:hypothetical protein
MVRSEPVVDFPQVSVSLVKECVQMIVIPMIIKFTYVSTI